MAGTRVAHPSVDERTAMGRKARERTPCVEPLHVKVCREPPDPEALLEEQDLTREPDLVRHGRMMVSRFIFYRGTAKS